MADQRMVRLAELEIDPDQLDAYSAFLTEEIATSVEREAGVLMLHAWARQDAPHRISILEVYASKAAYDAHILTPHFLKYKTGTAGMVTNLRLIDVDPILLSSK